MRRHTPSASRFPLPPTAIAMTTLLNVVDWNNARAHHPDTASAARHRATAKALSAEVQRRISAASTLVATDFALLEPRIVADALANNEM